MGTRRPEQSVDLGRQEFEYAQGFVRGREVSDAGVRGLVAQLAHEVPAGALLSGDDAGGDQPEAQSLLEQVEQRSGKKPGGSSAGSGQATIVPIEEGEIEGYIVKGSDAVRRARRRESQLVTRYVRYMRAQGDSVGRYRIVPGGTSPIFSDVFNESRKQLIEAKADAGRSDVRMAIGQLFDYSRFIPAPVRLAVLVDSRLPDDLSDLLTSQGIATVWPVEAGFTDDAGGDFT